jgi:hypothetical protein
MTPYATLLIRRGYSSRGVIKTATLRAIGLDSKTITASLDRRIQNVGVDNLVTNPRILAGAIGDKACNSALLKLNQIGMTSDARKETRRVLSGYVLVAGARCLTDLKRILVNV